MGFNLTKTDYMYVANTPRGSDFSRYVRPPPLRLPLRSARTLTLTRTLCLLLLR
jgi:hypothetical protein